MWVCVWVCVVTVQKATADVFTPCFAPHGNLVVYFVAGSVVHMLLHGFIVAVEVLGFIPSTSKFGSDVDKTWMRCNVPIWRAVAAAGVHLLLSVVAWIGCVNGAYINLFIYALGTTLAVATATPLTLLPLLTACGPPTSMPWEDIVKTGIEAALQVGVGMGTALLAAVIPLKALAVKFSQLSEISAAILSQDAPPTKRNTTTSDHDLPGGAGDSSSMRTPRALGGKMADLHAGSASTNIEMTSVFQSLVKSSTELQRANHQLMEELSSRGNAPPTGLGDARMSSGMFRQVAPSEAGVQTPLHRGDAVTWPTLDEHGRVALVVFFDENSQKAFMDAEQRRVLTQALRLDIAVAVDCAPERITLGNVSPLSAEVTIADARDAHADPDTRPSSALGKMLIAQAADRQSTLRQSMSGASIIRASWRPAWQQASNVTNGANGSPPTAAPSAQGHFGGTLHAMAIARQEQNGAMEVDGGYPTYTSATH